MQCILNLQSNMHFNALLVSKFLSTNISQYVLERGAQVHMIDILL